MNDRTYTLRNITDKLQQKIGQYIEAQYHIWDETLVRDRRRMLSEPGVIWREPYIEATPSYLPGAPFDRLGLPRQVNDILRISSEDQNTGVPRIPYSHQALALEAFFKDHADLVISTGTGSGKTESFLMPIVGSLATERAQRPESYARPGIRSLLIYPMNALVNDQLSRLRRLFAAPTVAQELRRTDGRRATFGVYTSRTPYPGPADNARTKREVGAWIDRFFIKYRSQEARLRAEGKWPAKDLTAFRASFETGVDDSELITRHEMQRRAPDVLVTNYSMLEYMLLRPVDAPLFTATRDWLAYSTENQLILVLDEAHLYQGAQGTEVALLLRRLVSRLRVTRDRIRFILTSASLAEGPDAEQIIRNFAADLTGGHDNPRRFAVVQGRLDKPQEHRAGTAKEGDAFEQFRVDALLSADSDLRVAAEALRSLASTMGYSIPISEGSAHELRDAAYAIAGSSPVARELVNAVMGQPMSLTQLATRVFPKAGDPIRSLDGLLALCAFARRAIDGRTFLPSRAHLLFRGLDGVFACINAQCSERIDTTSPSLLGRLYPRPRLRCSCGSRVYELLTHRDCGAAYLRGYAADIGADFLWHEPSTDLAGQGAALMEIHLLVEHARDQLGTANRVWLHKRTGQVSRNPPRQPNDYLELREPVSRPVPMAGRNVITFDRRCPVCRGRWRDASQPKIMDLTTKGEDPFSYLIATQVHIQPATTPVTAATPNAGRKSLLFSDGRQKAARLARDVPRVIEQDAFRQTLLLAAQQMRSIAKESRLSDPYIYVAFVAASAALNLRFFDASDLTLFREHQSTFRRRYSADLLHAIEDNWEVAAPGSFRVSLLRTLGSPYYSLCALGLGYVQPRRRVVADLGEALTQIGIAPNDGGALAVIWLRGLLEDFALYRRDSASKTARTLAAGYPITSIGSSSGFTADQRQYLRGSIDLDRLEASLAQHLTEPGEAADLRVISEGAVVLVPSLSDTWYRCEACTYLSPVTWRGNCAGCGQSQVRQVQPGQDEYMRARKSFWRDPVSRVLAGLEQPMTIDVEEHTAQLGFRDAGGAELEATTESFERRFRDILLEGECAIDVLSCTTTMEVGIDIGSLIAVGLRNMPPSRHNYQQRAGRAGRRGSAVSTVVTFAQNNPHDADLFENPARLISGQPTLTGLDLANPILVVRHAFAEILQEYFDSAVIRRVGGGIFAALGDTVPFFRGTGDASLAQLRDWVRTDPAATETLARIQGWLPSEARLTSGDCAERLLATLHDLTPTALAPLPRGEDKLIEFLFSHGVLPAYAFPRDLITLQIEAQDRHGQVQIIERPQQNASVGLSEYAPGRLVVVNKQTYRVGAVTANTTSETINRAAQLFASPQQYIQCPNCLYTMEPGLVAAGTTCPTCTAAQLSLVTVIQPEVVWPEGGGAISELDDDQTITDTTIAQLPIPASDRAFDHQVQYGQGTVLSHGRNVPLIIMNRGALGPAGPTGFMVCDQCGYTTVGTQQFLARHQRCYHIPLRRGQPSARPCHGQSRAVYLGYHFSTDVLLVRTVLASPFIHDLSDRLTFGALRDALNSIANGLALSAASELDIDPRELQSGYRLRRTGGGQSIGEFYLYDTLAGGAGYSSLIGNSFDRVLDATRERLNNCTCQSSCTGCLRTYGNRLHHHSLDRRLALHLIEYCRTGAVPALLRPEEQRDHAAPLREMLQMRGYLVEQGDFALRASHQGRHVIVGVLPTLRDPSALPVNWEGVIPLSVRELERDLPGCLSKVTL